METEIKTEEKPVIQKVTVRPVKRKDRKRLTKLLETFIEKLGKDELGNIIDSAFESSEKEDKNAENKKMVLFAISILKQVFYFLDEEVKPFLADLTGIPNEDFDEVAPFDVEIQIINQLSERPEFSSFFTGVSQGVSKMKMLSNG